MASLSRKHTTPASMSQMTFSFDGAWCHQTETHAISCTQERSPKSTKIRLYPESAGTGANEDEGIFLGYRDGCRLSMQAGRVRSLGGESE